MITLRSEIQRGEHPTQWLVVQKGAREHYAVARALHQNARLGALITDIWLARASVRAVMPAALRGRFHPDLRNARIAAANLNALTNELIFRASPDGSGARIIAHNSRFGRFAA